MTPPVDEGTALLAAADPAVNGIGERVLRVLADWPHPDPPTLNTLSAAVAAHWPWVGRPAVFEAVARLEDMGYLREEIR